MEYVDAALDKMVGSGGNQSGWFEQQWKKVVAPGKRAAVGRCARLFRQREREARCCGGVRRRTRTPCVHDPRCRPSACLLALCPPPTRAVHNLSLPYCITLGNHDAQADLDGRRAQWEWGAAAR